MKQLLSIKINAKPMPSPRPRLGRGGTFMPKKSKAILQGLRCCLLKRLP